MGFDKFTWMRAVYADRQLSGSAKAVAAYCATFYVRYGEETFAVRQETIAGRCGTTRKTVNAAFRDLREAGYLAKGQVRQVGRGYRGGNECRLVLPIAPFTHSVNNETSNEPLHDLLSNESLPDTGETCNENDPERVTKLPKTCNPPNASTSENATPIRVLEGSVEGSGETPPNGISVEPPKRACTKHDHWAGDHKCLVCQADRLAFDAWHKNSIKLLRDLDRERDSYRTAPKGRQEISAERMARIRVFQDLGLDHLQ